MFGFFAQKKSDKPHKTTAPCCSPAKATEQPKDKEPAPVPPVKKGGCCG